jgi:hypothetical protein
LSLRDIRHASTEPTPEQISLSHLSFNFFVIWPDPEVDGPGRILANRGISGRVADMAQAAQMTDAVEKGFSRSELAILIQERTCRRNIDSKSLGS